MKLTKIILIINELVLLDFVVSILFFRDMYFGLFHENKDHFKFEGHAAAMELDLVASVTTFFLGNSMVLYCTFKKDKNLCLCVQRLWMAFVAIGWGMFAIICIPISNLPVKDPPLKFRPMSVEGLMLFFIFLALLHLYGFWKTPKELVVDEKKEK